jgi:hypothetical protein
MAARIDPLGTPPSGDPMLDAATHDSATPIRRAASTSSSGWR